MRNARCLFAENLIKRLRKEMAHFALKIRCLKAQQLATISECKCRGGKRVKLKQLKWNLLDLYTFNLHS